VQKGGLDIYYIVLPIYAIILTVFCLSNIQKTHLLQRIIGIIRFCVIGLMVYGAFYQIITNPTEINHDIKTFNMDYFGYLIGNTVLSFM
jgi:hypothetical protein